MGRAELYRKGGPAQKMQGARKLRATGNPIFRPAVGINNKTMQMVLKRWTERKRAEVVKTKLPQKLKEIAGQTPKPSRTQINQAVQAWLKGEEHRVMSYSHPIKGANATGSEVAMRFAGKGLTEKARRLAGLNPEAAQTFSRLFRTTTINVPEIKLYVGLPTAIIMLKLINKAGFRRANAAVKVVSRESSRIMNKNKHNKKLSSYHSDAFNNISSMFSMAHTLRELMLLDKRNGLEAAMDTIHAREEALAKLKAHPEVQNYNSIAKRLASEIEEGKREAEIFKQQNGL